MRIVATLLAEWDNVTTQDDAVERARGLLAEAGLNDADQRALPDAHSIRSTLLTSQILRSVSTFSLIAPHDTPLPTSLHLMILLFQLCFIGFHVLPHYTS